MAMANQQNAALSTAPGATPQPGQTAAFSPPGAPPANPQQFQNQGNTPGMTPPSPVMSPGMVNTMQRQPQAQQRTA